MKLLSRSTNLAFIGIPLLIAGCGSISIWPFGEGKPSSVSRGPENATEYRCDAGKSFYVRYLDGGKSAWVILSDRQVRLDKIVSESGNSFSNGIAVLRIEASEAMLTDGPNVSLANCKAANVTNR
jgi:membrane-bound inhibitor of C-type lysozyme